MFVKRAHRLKKYVETRWWIYKKQKEITKLKNQLLAEIILFDFIKIRDGIFAADGSDDISLRYLYKLKGHGLIVTGSSRQVIAQVRLSINFEEHILNKFNKKIKKGGWWYDKVAIGKKIIKLRIEKQKAITAGRAGISIFKNDVSIPN